MEQELVKLAKTLTEYTSYTHICRSLKTIFVASLTYKLEMFAIYTQSRWDTGFSVPYTIYEQLLLHMVCYNTQFFPIIALN